MSPSDRQSIIVLFRATRTQMNQHAPMPALSSHFEGRLDGIIAVMNILDPDLAEQLLDEKVIG